MPTDDMSRHDSVRNLHPPLPFLVVGVGRSGTTLLRNMLNRHRDLALPPESHFIPRLWKHRRRYGSKGRIERPERFLLDLAADTRFRNWDLPLDAVRRELMATPSASFSQAVAAIYRAYAAAHCKALWGDKTPVYVESMALLGRLFPHARFVHMIRDGRDVALSMLDREGVSKYRSKKPLHRQAATPAFFWARRIRIARRTAKSLGAGRYYEIRYEDLLDDPDGQLRRLCGFLGVDYDPGMLAHDDSGLEAVPSSQRWIHTRLALPPTKGLRDWRTQMSPAEVAEFEAVARRQLTALGYPLLTGSSLLAWLRAWGRITWFAIRSFDTRMRRRMRRQRRRRELRRLPEAA